MSGKKETLFEKIFKPARFNPVMNLIGIILMSTDNTISDIGEKNINGYLFGCGLGLIISSALFGLGFYLKDKKVLKNKGYNERYAKLRMKEYCNRQAFYMAAVNQGYRDEVINTIETTPIKEMKFSSWPHA